MVTAVTTPNPPLPPRIAQNRSGYESADTVIAPSAGVTTSNDRTWSVLNPHVLASGPRPPPNRYPTTPTPGAEPHGAASPCGVVAARTGSQVHPAPTRTVWAEASTSTASIDRSVIARPPRTSASRPC